MPEISLRSIDFPAEDFAAVLRDEGLAAVFLPAARAADRRGLAGMSSGASGGSLNASIAESRRPLAFFTGFDANALSTIPFFAAMACPPRSRHVAAKTRRAIR